MAKICPFTMTTAIVPKGFKTPRVEPTYCLEAKCAIWTGTECAILTIALKKQ